MWPHGFRLHGVHDADALLIVDDGVGGDGEEEDVTVTVTGYRSPTEFAFNLLSTWSIRFQLARSIRLRIRFRIRLRIRLKEFA